MVPLPFAMWVGEHEGVLMVRLAGRLEAPWAEEVRRELSRSCPTALWLDLSGLTAIDAAGLGALLDVRQDVLCGGGRCVLHGARGATWAKFAAAGLDALVDDERVPVAPASQANQAGPLAHLPLKGGRNARRSPAAAPKVA